mgnify:CR=1 FL=1
MSRGMSSVVCNLFKVPRDRLCSRSVVLHLRVDVENNVMDVIYPVIREISEVLYE